MKIVCLCAFRDAGEQLPGFIYHLTGFVDHFVFLSDRSNDVLLKKVLDDPNISWLARHGGGDQPHIYEAQNRAILLTEARYLEADWVLCLDVDERPSKPFLASMEPLCANARGCVITAKEFDLWNSLRLYRRDGYWGRRVKPVIFKMSKEPMLLQPVGLHMPWVDHQDDRPQMAEFPIYHLGSLTPELRKARREKHEALDPMHQYQDSYAHLDDESGCQVFQVPDGWL